MASSLASQLPQNFVVNAVIENNADTGGSWLASDGGGRFTIDVHCHSAFASRLAPTRGLHCNEGVAVIEK